MIRMCSLATVVMLALQLAAASRKEINGWVSDHTAKEIDELLEPGVLSPLTRLVLTNAVFMKAAWATPFDKAATGVVIGIRSALPPQEEPLEVRADRPFAWAVVHQGTGAVLFAGTVTDPR